MAGFVEIGSGIFVLRYPMFDVNASLVVGDAAALMVDTLSTAAQGRLLLDEARRVTTVPLLVVNTHHHFDHFFGNAAFRPAPMWALDRCRERCLGEGEPQRAAMAEHARAAGREDMVSELAETEIVPPDRTFERTAVLDVGGREVRLAHLGRAHTDNDVAVSVPDAGVVFAGDLVEQGAPPSFDDAYPLDWPATAARLADLVTGALVPGHGAVVDAAFAEAQRGELVALAELARRGYAAGAPVDEVLGEAPFGGRSARVALERAYAQLAGRL